MKTFNKLLISFVLFGAVCFAQVPRTISYQGVLTDVNGAPVADRTYQIQLALYLTPTGGTPIFSEMQTVAVFKGLINVNIGSVNQLPTSVDFDRQYFLGISLDGGSELIPRTALTSAPYALRSSIADAAKSLAPGANGVVTSINNQSGGITFQGGGGTTVSNNGNTITISSTGGTGSGIGGVQNTDGSLAIQNPNGPVATINLNNNGINKDKIASGQVVKSLNNLHDDVQLVAGNNVTIAPTGNTLTISAVGGNGGTGIQGVQSSNGTLDISNGTGPVANINVRDNGISTNQLANDAVNTAKIANGAVTAQKLAPGLIPNELPPTGAAGGDLQGNYPNPMLAANAATTAKIANGAVTLQKIAAGVIPTSLPPNGAAGGDLSGNYPNPNIAANAVTNAKISDGAVTPAKISSSGAVNGDVLKYNGTGVVWGSVGGNSSPWTLDGNSIYNSNPGNVGIGNTNPLSRLHVTGGSILLDNSHTISQKDETGVIREVLSTGNSGVVYLRGFHATPMITGVNGATYLYGSGDPTYTVMTLKTSGNVGVGITNPLTRFEVIANGNDAYHGIGIKSTLGGGKLLTINQGQVGKLNFTEPGVLDLMTLNFNNGFVGIGTTSPGYKLHVIGQGYATGGWASPSDARFKMNIINLSGALAKVQALRGVYYNWRIASYPEYQFRNSREIGLIAQEVEEVIPEIVFTDDHGYKSLEYSHLTALLVEAVKEQQQQIEKQAIEISSLKNDIAHLQKQASSNNDLQSRLAALEARVPKSQQTTNPDVSIDERSSGASK